MVWVTAHQSRLHCLPNLSYRIPCPQAHRRKKTSCQRYSISVQLVNPRILPLWLDWYCPLCWLPCILQLQSWSRTLESTQTSLLLCQGHCWSQAHLPRQLGVRIQTWWALTVLMGTGWLAGVKAELNVFRWVPTGERPAGTWGLYEQMKNKYKESSGVTDPWNVYVIGLQYYRVKLSYL